MTKIEKLFPIIGACITNKKIKNQVRTQDKIFELLENKVSDTIAESQEWIIRNAYLDEKQTTSRHRDKRVMVIGRSKHCSIAYFYYYKFFIGYKNIVD